MSSDALCLIVLGLALLYAFVRGLVDCQQKRYVWGALGLACAAVIFIALTIPIPSHAVKYDLPRNGQ